MTNAESDNATPTDARPEAAVVYEPHRAPLEIPRDYVPSPESSHLLYQVATPSYEGPLDLLLFLIKRHKLDIFDIPIGFICDRYIEYIDMMEDLNIDVAAEFMYTAAELAHIKSKMLLPSKNDGSDEDEGDPRAELVARLLEYQKFKDAALQLNSHLRLGHDVFDRPPEPLPGTEHKRLKEANVLSLVDAFAAVLKRQKPEVRHRVLVETVSLQHRMHSLVELLRERDVMPFVELLGSFRLERIEIIVTFLAVLEMTRLKLLRVYESEEGCLYVHPRLDTFDGALERIDGVDDHGYVG